MSANDLKQVTQLAEAYGKDPVLIRDLYLDLGKDMNRLQDYLDRNDPATNWESQKSKTDKSKQKGQGGNQRNYNRPRNNDKNNNSENKEQKPERKEQKNEQKPPKEEKPTEKINLATGAHKSKKQQSFPEVKPILWGEVLEKNGQLISETPEVPKAAPPVQEQPKQEAPKAQEPAKEPAQEKKPRNQSPKENNRNNKKEKQQKNEKKSDAKQEQPKEEPKPEQPKAEPKPEPVPEKPAEQPQEQKPQPVEAKPKSRSKFGVWTPDQNKQSQPVQPVQKVEEPKAQEQKQGFGFDSVLSPSAIVQPHTPVQPQAAKTEEKKVEQVAEPVYKYNQKTEKPLQFPPPRTNGPETILRLPISLEKFPAKNNLFGIFGGPIKPKNSPKRLDISNSDSQQRFEDVEQRISTPTQSDKTATVDKFVDAAAQPPAPAPQQAPAPATQQAPANQQPNQQAEFQQFLAWKNSQQMYQPPPYMMAPPPYMYPQISYADYAMFSEFMQKKGQQHQQPMPMHPPAGAPQQQLSYADYVMFNEFMQKKGQQQPMMPQANMQQFQEFLNFKKSMTPNQ